MKKELPPSNWSKRQKPHQMSAIQWIDWLLVRLLSVFGAVALGYIVYRIFHTDPGFSGGTGADLNSALLVQANDRLLMLVQWTLGLVITTGGLLVGYSWFQQRSRADLDRERIDLHVERLSAKDAAREEKMSEVERTLALLALANEKHSEFESRSMVRAQFTEQMFRAWAHPADSVFGSQATAIAVATAGVQADLQKVITAMSAFVSKILSESDTAPSSNVDFVFNYAAMTVRNVIREENTFYPTIVEINNHMSAVRDLLRREEIGISLRALVENWNYALEEMRAKIED